MVSRKNFHERLKESGLLNTPQLINLSLNEIKSHSMFEWKCIKCGASYKRRVSRQIGNQLCMRCSQNPKKSSYTKLLKNSHSDYPMIRRQDKVELTCYLHGKYYSPLYNVLKNRHLCPKCRSERFTKKRLLYCYKHQLFYWRSLRQCKISLKTNPFTCPKCIKESSAHKHSITMRNRNPLSDKFISEFLDYTLYKDGLLTVNDRGRFVCNKHGEYTQLIYDHIAGNGCPKCAKRWESTEELQVVDYIKSLGYQVEQHNRTLIKNPETNCYYEIDIFIPTHNVAFEFNGIYWHSEYFLASKNIQNASKYH